MTGARTEAKPQKVMYSFGYESRARALNGFGDMFNLPDFEERRARLVAGLDKESTAVVNRILRRLKTILKLKEGETVDLYTKEELNALADSKRLLQDKIVQLAPDLFAWNGYALPRKHFEPNVFLDGYGFRFIETLGSIGGKAIIDAGAYIGDSALMLSPLTTGKVYAFEPMLENFSCLEKTIWLNGLDNVVPVHKALGDKEGKLTMTVGNAGACATVSNRIPSDNLKEESVNVVKLDDFVRDEGVHVGLIKTDVEGAEQMLLRGAMETIRRDKPILLISIYHNASDFLDIKPMIESWNLGYQFQIYHPPIKSISGETVLIAEHNRQANRVSIGPLPELTTANRYVLRVLEENIRSTNNVAHESKYSLEAQTTSLLQMRISRDEAQKKVVAMRDARDGAFAELTKMRDARDEAQKKVVAMREGRDSAQAELAKMREARDEAQRKVVAMRESRDGVQKLLAQMRENRDGALAELAKMRDARDEAQKKVVAMREARDGAQKQLAQMREGRDSAQAELAKMREARDEAQRKVVAMRESRDGVQKLLAQMREGRDSAQAELAGMREARDEAQKKVVAMRDGRDGALAELAKMREARDEAQRQVVAMREARDGAQRQLAKMRDARDEAAKKVVAMREARDSALSRAKSAGETSAMLKRTNQRLNARVRHFEDVERRLNAVLNMGGG